LSIATARSALSSCVLTSMSAARSNSCGALSATALPLSISIATASSGDPAAPPGLGLADVIVETPSEPV